MPILLVSYDLDVAGRTLLAREIGAAGEMEVVAVGRDGGRPLFSWGPEPITR